MRARLDVFISDWSRAGLGIFPYQDRLPSSCTFADRNALKKYSVKSENTRKNYFVKTCTKIFRKTELQSRPCNKLLVNWFAPAEL